LIEYPSPVERRAADVPVVGEQRRAAGRAWRGNRGGKVERIHAAAGQSLVWSRQHPGAVCAVGEHVGGNECPPASVGGGGGLAIPQTALRHINRWIGDVVRIDQHMVQTARLDEAFDVGELDIQSRLESLTSS